MKIRELLEWGRIVKGVNTTVDVGTNEIKKQAKKFGNIVDKDGRPQNTSRKTKNKSTNVLYNLGLAESTVQEIETDPTLTKDMTTPYDFDEYIDNASPTGIKIKGYEIWKPDDSHVNDDSVELVLLVKDPDSEGFLGEFALLTQYTSTDSFVSSQIIFTEEIQGKGIALPLYAYVITKLGYTVVSDKTQTKGSRRLWERLHKARNIFVYAWNQDRNKFFQWDPEVDPDEEVYVDQEAKDDLYADLKNVNIEISKQVKNGELDQDDAEQLIVKRASQIKSELANLETVRMDNLRLVATAKKGLAMNENIESRCPRTRATSCQCESVNTITESEEALTAVCELEQSNKVKGTILFKQQPKESTLIVGKITGLTPGEHGFHIHEFGDLSDGCKSAGGHYNPDNVDHGDIEQGHVGDLGNITANNKGIAVIKIIADRVDLSGDRSVVGRSIVVHSDRDDLGQGNDAESRKTGNAGDRLACGVITLRETVSEQWSKSYKKSINCSNPKGFSQKAHCQSKKKNENFADGKKKGKSRPGRASKAGVDCSKSVSALRKQAKSSSGEKQKMAHWCANMKSGRKKS